MPRKERSDATNVDDTFLPEPVLSAGERLEDYLELYATFEKEMAPVTLFDKIRVRDLTDKLWQEQRLKRRERALLESARIESLAELLSARFGEDKAEAIETAQDYYSGIPERVRRVHKSLMEMDITDDHIEANAFHLRSAGLQALGRMNMHNETTRNAIMKDHEKRQRRAEKEKQKNSVGDKATPRVMRVVRD